MQTNNKLRESIVQVKELARTIYSTSDKGSSHEDLAEKIVELANAIIAVPPRNCDVGTAEEQSARWWKFCEKHFIHSPAKDNCAKCPIHGTNRLHGTNRHCELAWAQMPYKEGDDR